MGQNLEYPHWGLGPEFAVKSEPKLARGAGDSCYRRSVGFEVSRRVPDWYAERGYGKEVYSTFNLVDWEFMDWKRRIQCGIRAKSELHVTEMVSHALGVKSPAHMD